MELNDIMDRIDEALDNEPIDIGGNTRVRGVIKTADAGEWEITGEKPVKSIRIDWLFRIILKIKRLFKWQ